MYLATCARAAIERVPIYDPDGLVDAATVRARYMALCDHLIETVPRGEIVGIHLEKEPRFLLAICAAFETGTTFVPLNTDWPADRVGQVKAITSCRAIIDRSNIDAICRRAPRDWAPIRPAAPTDIAYVMCTSGTTGRPKAVATTREGYETFVRWVDGFLPQIDDTDHVLLTSDFTFDMALVNMALFLSRHGAHHVSRFKDDVFALAAEIERQSISFLMVVPSTLNILLMSAVTRRYRLDSLRHLLLGGSRFSYGLYQTIRDTLPNARFYNLYGPTECSVAVHATELSGDPAADLFDSNVTIGRPMTGTTCLLVDSADREITNSRTSGELLLGGRQVMAGYLGDAQATAAAVTVRDGQRYYRTGDLAFRDDRGNYYIAGRIDETLKRRGFRVNLLDIDSYVQRVDLVRECMTIAIPHEAHDHWLVTYAVVSTPVTVDDLLERLRVVLADFQLPDEVRFVDALPRGATGKVDRKQLEARFRSEE